MYYSDFIKHGEVLIQRDETYLAHHGIKGQKWGIRRYQNPDGSLTEEGKKRYLNSDGTLKRSYAKRKYSEQYNDYLNKQGDLEDKFDKTVTGKSLLKKMYDAWDKASDFEMSDQEAYEFQTGKSSEKHIEKLWKEYDKAENKYLKTKFENTVNELAKQYSDAELSALSTYEWFPTSVREDLPRQESIRRLISRYERHKA